MENIMSIKKSKSFLNSKYKNHVLQELQKLKLSQFGKQEPEFLVKLDAFITDISTNISKNTTPATILNDSCADIKEITKLVIEATELENWSKPETETLTLSEINELKYMFNVNFQTTDIKKYIFSRKTTHRDDFGLIIITALPGYFYVSLQTSRVGIDLDYLMTKKEFVSHIYSEIQNS